MWACLVGLRFFLREVCCGVRLHGGPNFPNLGFEEGRYGNLRKEDMVPLPAFSVTTFLPRKKIVLRLTV